MPSIAPEPPGSIDLDPPAAVLRDDLLQRLEDMIVSGELALGERLGEQALADRLGVSRGPVREAIRTLEGRRMLERTPGAGVRVVALSIDDVEHLLVAREALEGMCARLAAENMTLREVQGLRACLDRDPQRLQREGAAATLRRGTQDHDFHARIAAGSRNNWLAQYLTDDVYSLLRLYRIKQISLGGRAAEAQLEHYAIVEEIQKRNPDGAEQLMRAHVRMGRERLLDELRQH